MFDPAALDQLKPFVLWARQNQAIEVEITSSSLRVRFDPELAPPKPVEDTLRGLHTEAEERADEIVEEMRQRAATSALYNDGLPPLGKRQ